jgi:hypothetical protein
MTAEEAETAARMFKALGKAIRNRGSRGCG